MDIKSQKIEVHWNYLLSIENNIENLSRYIEFDEKNFECFSIEIARILLASSAETDVVCKQLCLKLDPTSTAESINQYRDVIGTAFPKINEFEVLFPRYGLSLVPWDAWKDPLGVPAWWTAYNKVKHNRESEYYRANLKNVLHSIAGLFVMILYLYQDKASLGELLPAPKLLRVSEKHFTGITHGGYDLGFVYSL